MKILGEKQVLAMVNGAKMGDDEARERLVNYFTPSIKAKCSKYNINGYEYEDLMGEGVRTLLKCVKSYKEGSAAFPPYFFRALSNELNYILRKSYRDSELSKKTYNSKERVEEALDIEEKLYREEMCHKIAYHIKTLNGDEKIVIEKIYYGGKSMAEVSRELGFPFHKVQYIRNLVLKKIRTALKQ